MMTHTRQWRSRRHLRRTYSIKHTGRTVRYVNCNKDIFERSFSPSSSDVFLSPGEIALLEGLTVVYKSNIDLFFYVIGSSHENEVSLIVVVNCFYKAHESKWQLSIIHIGLNYTRTIILFTVSTAQTNTELNAEFWLQESCVFCSPKDFRFIFPQIIENNTLL